MSANTAPPTFSAGEKVAAPKLNQLGDFARGALDVWDAYAPAVTGFTLGNSTVVARWRRIGQTVEGRVDITLGSTATFSGLMSVGLPIAPRSDYLPNTSPVGTAILTDASAPAKRSGTAILSAGLGNVYVFIDATSAQMTSTVPWTWAAGDTISVQFSYETAAA